MLSSAATLNIHETLVWSGFAGFLGSEKRHQYNQTFWLCQELSCRGKDLHEHKVQLDFLAFF